MGYMSTVILHKKAREKMRKLVILTNSARRASGRADKKIAPK